MKGKRRSAVCRRHSSIEQPDLRTLWKTSICQRQRYHSTIWTASSKLSTGQLVKRSHSIGSSTSAGGSSSRTSTALRVTGGSFFLRGAGQCIGSCSRVQQIGAVSPGDKRFTTRRFHQPTSGRTVGNDKSRHGRGGSGGLRGGGPRGYPATSFVTCTTCYHPLSKPVDWQRKPRAITTCPSSLPHTVRGVPLKNRRVRAEKRAEECRLQNKAHLLQCGENGLCC